MPSSRPSGIPTIVHVIKLLAPKSILDVGVGFGKWGCLFREYTDVVASEHEAQRYHKDHWSVRIDGVEGFSDYLTPLHSYLYDTIHIGLAQDLVDDLPCYDVIFMGDIIEHLPKNQGHILLEKMLSKANKAVIVSTPKYDTRQGERVGNKLEEHHSVWTKADFLRYPGANVRTIDFTLLLAVIVKPGVPVPSIRPQITGLSRKRTPWRYVIRAVMLWMRISDRIRARRA